MSVVIEGCWDRGTSCIAAWPAPRFVHTRFRFYSLGGEKDSAGVDPFFVVVPLKAANQLAAVKKMLASLCFS